VACVLVAFLGTSNLWAQKEFSIPLDQLRVWSDSLVVSMNVDIEGNSKVHKVYADCEMHFGAKLPGYNGEPSGWVLEPMNICVEAFPGKSTQSNKDWETWGAKLRGARVRADGVPRIWPEHLSGGTASNPDHALELHPLVRLQRGTEVFDFTKYVYAPEGFEGGVKEETAAKILTDTEVSVTERSGMVTISFDAGRIGNFTTLDLTVQSDTIAEVKGGHRMTANVNLGRRQKTSVKLVTVAGTDFDKTIGQALGRRSRALPFELLVLFSLNPEALYNAAKMSNGREVPVPDALQLIAYGEAEGNDDAK
jgi:hypothetical protein